VGFPAIATIGDMSSSCRQRTSLLASEPFVLRNAEHPLDDLSEKWPRAVLEMAPSPHRGGADLANPREVSGGHHLSRAGGEGAGELDSCTSSHDQVLAWPNNSRKLIPHSTGYAEVFADNSFGSPKLGRMGTKPTDLSPEGNRRLRKAMREFIDHHKAVAKRQQTPEKYGQNSLAEALELSTGSISNFLNAKGGASVRTALRFAKLAGIDHEQFFTADDHGVGAQASATIEDPRAAGFRRFAEYIEDELPELTHFLAAFREERFAAQYRMPKNDKRTRVDWETQWKQEFRDWRMALGTKATHAAYKPGSKNMTGDD
jgi:hypothetical protein